MPHLLKENALRKQGFRFIAGLDEAGRGAWAGPVVAAAVILPFNQPNLTTELAGLDDSKRLSAKRRAQFFEVIGHIALAYSVGLSSAEEVDTLNVVGATRLAMQRAIAALDPAPDFLLVDHIELPQVALPQNSFPKADRVSLSVAAASVLAKVTRDRLLVDLDADYPAYGFARHKGYGTRIHREALAEYGPCPVHRFSFRSVQVRQLKLDV